MGIAVWESKVVPFLKNCRFHRDTCVNQIKYNHYYKNYRFTKRKWGNDIMKKKHLRKVVTFFLLAISLMVFMPKAEAKAITKSEINKKISSLNSEIKKLKSQKSKEVAKEKKQKKGLTSVYGEVIEYSPLIIKNLTGEYLYVTDKKYLNNYVFAYTGYVRKTGETTVYYMGTEAYTCSICKSVKVSNKSYQTANVKMAQYSDMEKAYSTNGISIALMYTDGSGNFKYDLHDLSSKPTYSDGAYTFTWDTSVSGETPTGCSRYTVAIYFGAKNIVSSGSSSSSAGKYQSLALTSSGIPVIVYYDAENEKLKIAYCSASSNGATASNWTRQTISGVSGGTYVQAKIDGGDCLHIMYRNSLGELCYLKSTYNPDNNPEKNGYKFGSPMTIDSSGTYGTLSVMKTDSGYVPCVSWLNSEGTANGVKYALLRKVDTGNGNTESLWDVQIVPAVVDGGNHYVSGGELVYVEGKSGSWNATEDSGENKVSMGDCDAVVGFNTGRMDVVFLKSEK